MGLTWVDVPGFPLSWPSPAGGGSFTSGGSIGITAANHFVAYKFAAPKAGTIDAVVIAFDTVGKAPANGLTVGFATLDQGSNGTTTAPSTLSHYGSVTQAQISADVSAETSTITDDGTATGTKKTVTKGELLVVTAGFTSFESGDSVNFCLTSTGPFTISTGSMGWPCTEYTTNGGTSWLSNSFSGSVNIALKYSDGTYVTPFGCIQQDGLLGGTNTWTFGNTGGSPNEYGIKFTAPFDMRVTGAYFCGMPGSSIGGGLRIRVYDENDTVLAASPPLPQNNVLDTAKRFQLFTFTGTATLTRGSTYRLAAYETGVVVASLYYIPFLTGKETARIGGSACVPTYRDGTAEGAWTDDAEVRTGVKAQPGIGLLIDQVNYGTDFSASANASAAADLVVYLDALMGQTAGTDLFEGPPPELPNTLVALTEYGGEPARDRVMGASLAAPGVEVALVQLFVRDTTMTAAKSTADTYHAALDNMNDTIGSRTYFHVESIQGMPHSMGQDKNGLWRYACNYRVFYTR